MSLPSIEDLVRKIARLEQRQEKTEQEIEALKLEVHQLRGSSMTPEQVEEIIWRVLGEIWPKVRVWIRNKWKQISGVILALAFALEVLAGIVDNLSKIIGL